ncbi:hypothetical protein [Mucilaginibacter lappiensis]|uniref:Uncharacterized protein n=1 Tax=Mucilaginibacter lappiensis TaxID=354630 RepID=A0A1N7FST6_9SPHI|nr:hypothetical protein [Mucilaginibacter lappiensis]MBB6112576.1 hypothetical protein [Mucilaginibacter lappiensis]MBB6129186.1 hypothetical protein [Mucilaginibacter lappiensis]SIS03326.1 hypothetical protein SAMN05421821_119112 [Mucilaginibacter lappiensis]
MNRILATFVLFAHLFNAGGYLVLNQYLVNQSDKFVTDQISKGKYDTNNLIEIKIKQHLPQIRDWKAYARVSGQIQLNGVAYNYVKLKMTRDTLFVQCIPNYETTNLLNENIICAKQVNDIPVSKKAHESSGKKTGADNKYNFPTTSNILFAASPEVKKLNTFIYISIRQPLIQIAGRPPETMV